MVSQEEISSNYTLLLIHEKLQGSVIEFQDENKHLLSRKIIPVKKSYSVINALVKEFLQKHWITFIDMEEIQEGNLGVLTSDNVFLDLKLLPDMYSLFNEIQDIYFEQRKEGFLFNINQIQSVSLDSSFNNREASGQVFSTASKQLFAKYIFLSQEETLLSRECEFLDFLVGNFLFCNSENLFLREIYDWHYTSFFKKSKEKIIPISGWTVQNEGLANYVLQKGKLELKFSPFLLPEIMKRIELYEKNTEQKLFRVLNGGK